MTHASSLLGAFISPALFAGGAAAVAAPILIHLLARRRFKRIRWAAMDFLIDAERRNRRRLRMEEWILLFLRCLAVLFIAAMIARPFFNPASAAVIWGGSQLTEHVFVLDDSLSMAYRIPDGTPLSPPQAGPERTVALRRSEGPGTSPFGLAKQAVRRLIESIRRETPDDTVTILRMSAPTSPVESGTYLDETQTADLFARLDALAPTQRSIDPGSAMEGVAEVLERNPGITNAAVYILSDFQRHDWVQSQNAKALKSQPVKTSSLSQARPERTVALRRSEGRGTSPSDRQNGEAFSILQPLSAWAGDERGLRLVLINVGVDDAANLAVTELGIQGGQLVAGAAGIVRAKVSNYANQSIENLELRVSVGQLSQPSRTLRELAARQSASVDLDTEFVQAGSTAVRVELPPDALPADNIRYVAADVAGAIRILLVNGEPSADEFDDEVTFLATALRPEGEVFSGNEIIVVDEADFEDANLAGFHVVVLANVYRLSDLGVESLERFVREGGGLLVFLGDQVDADLYNTALYRNGDGLLPAELTEVIRAADVSHLVVTDRLHPALRGAQDRLGIGQIAFFKYFGCVPFDVTAEEAIENDSRREGRGGGLIPPGRIPPPPFPSERMGDRRIARVIARFDDSDEHPAIVGRLFGRGEVILVTTTVDKEWHHWPDHPTFLPVMMELVHHVARRSDTGVTHWVGESIELPLDPAVYQPDAIVRTPAYPNEHEVSLTAAPASDGRGLLLHWEHTDAAGIYQFVLQRREGGQTVRLAAVNIDPRESDLTMAQEDELRRAMDDVPFDYVKGLDGLSGAVGERRTELWRLFLFATAAVLMCEQCLAWWWGRRR